MAAAVATEGARLPHSWAEARQVAFDHPAPLPGHRVPLEEALGRILSDELTALADIPHYASSAMDGWAVAGSPPWVLAEPGHRLSPGEASPIVTGGLIPAGARSVLRSESGRIARDSEGLPVLALSGRAKPGEPKAGQHIRKAGEEAVAGEILAAVGTVLNPAHLALAAIAGHDFVPVLGRPTVKLVLTGDEVISAGLPAAGQVRDVFSVQLGGVLAMLNGEVLSTRRIGDTLAATLEAFADSPEAPADVLLTTGGTGSSAADHIRSAVAALDGTLLVDGIAMRPGHPTLLAELPDGRYVLGLPGNPLAAMMGLFTLGAPLLARLGSRPMPASFEVACGSPVAPSPGRTRLVPYRLLYGLASPALHSGSAMLRGLATADGVLVVPPHGVKMGEPVPAFALPWKP